jgi:nitrile hydratase beta subunit/nitrile hydratase accessory protein
MTWAACTAWVLSRTNEPVFHEAWEGRVYAITRAIGAWRKWNIDAGRHGIELIAPADYLRMSYYEKWLERNLALLVQHGLVTQEEIETGKPGPGSQKLTPPLTAEVVHATAARRGSYMRPEADAKARFNIGDKVRARKINPTGHTRLPRYARGREGVIARHHGIFYSRIQTRTSRASSLNTCIRCASRRRSCGVKTPRRGILSTSTCGIATLSTPDLQSIPLLPRDDAGPVFAEPWQAQAFALAVRLSAEGYFTWKEWSSALAEELKSAQDRGEPDDGTRYYVHWLAALERLVTARGLLDTAALLARKEAWADAYRHTPHGKPVVLSEKS